ncbi:MAG: ABC transporter permease [Patescibacteria group bacterium]|nr:ABC transporter permease [Patescibacteria group bacterium]
MKTILDLWQIAKKDLLEFTRDRLRLVTFFIMPMFMMIMVGFIFPSQNSLKNTPIGIANQNTGQAGVTLVNTITNLKLSPDKPDLAFKITNYNNIDEIKNGIKSQQISGGLFIPSDFSAKIAANEQAEVTIVQDQSNPQISQMIDQILSQVVSGFGSQVGIQKINQLNSKISAKSIMAPITSKIEGIIPGNPNYFEFVAPGIMAMIVMTAVLTGLAASISREKEQGTLDGILISPINRLAIVLGKATAQAIRGLIQGAIVLLLAFLLFGVTIHGNLLLIILLLLLGIFSFVGLGILVSAIASEQETATQLLFMFQFPMLFLSGVFFPIALMPNFMQKIAHVIPLTYAITALRKVMVLGAGVGEVKSEMLILAIFGVVTLAISVPIFKRVITK